ncbi:uncharacterized protein LOC143549056 [Bidens hawaiensis]|uniref:uncharacterized protein LOC143549056 n=1 Tax=Bidens hawaiensis TaxID=980011 RepID=UPI00404B7220
MTTPPPETNSSSLQQPLTDSNNHTTTDSPLHLALNKLESFLNLLGFCQYTPLTTTLSWISFLIIGVITPLLLILYSDYSKYQIKRFELEVILSQAVVAAISLLCVSHNLRKYGVRKLLFVDCHDAYAVLYPQLYIQKIYVSFRTFSEGWGCVTLLASLVTWAYSAIVFLSGTALFNLVGNLQVIRIENYGKILERDLDVSVYIEEHTRLAYCLSKISHRFRAFLLLEFLVVTACQFSALLQTTENQGIINFINTGDFAISKASTWL